MKSLVLFCTLFFYCRAAGQDSVVTRTVDEQVWKPFVAAYNTYNAESYMDLHSQQLVRVTTDSRRVLNYEAYHRSMSQNSETGIAEKRLRTIELRFSSRMHGETGGYETGLYKITVRRSPTDVRISYGVFSVVLTKEAGTWKILVDVDTKQNATEETFNGLPKWD